MKNVFLKFDKDKNLLGKFEESEIIAQFPLPISIETLSEIVTALLDLEWVKVGDFYYVLFNEECQHYNI